MNRLQMRSLIAERVPVIFSLTGKLLKPFMRYGV